MYYPMGFAESIFAQACVLARTMGLHQGHSAPDGVSPEEAQERFKVFRSLYLRDKSVSVSRGSICWLPSFDCSLSSKLGDDSPANSKFANRIQLARFQDESYRLFHSADARSQSSAKYKGALIRFEQGLEHWAYANEILGSPYSETRDVDLQLEFLAARISVFRRSPEVKHVRQALNDSRASCLWLIISYGKSTPSMIEKLNALLLSKSPSKSLGRNTSERPSKASSSSSSSESMMGNPGDPFPLRSHSLLETFPIPGFFLLASNVIRPSSAYDESQADEDLDLLQRTCACYQEFGARTQAHNHTRKVGRAFEKILEVITLTKLQPSGIGIQKTQGTPILSHSSSEQLRIPASGNLSSPSISSIPPLSWDNFSNNSITTTTAGSPSASTSPGLLTPLETQYQSFDPLRQNFYFTYPQQQGVPQPNLTRQHTSESDVPMDDFSESRLLSEFLATNAPMPFDITP